MVQKNYTPKGAWRHFRTRLDERYQWEISHGEWLKLHEQTKQGQNFVCRSSNTKTWWLVQCSKGQIFALYDSKHHYFISVLSLRTLEKAMEGDKGLCKYLGLTTHSKHLTLWYDLREPIRQAKAVELARVRAQKLARRPVRDVVGEQGSGCRDVYERWPVRKFFRSLRYRAKVWLQTARKSLSTKTPKG